MATIIATNDRSIEPWGRVSCGSCRLECSRLEGQRIYAHEERKKHGREKGREREREKERERESERDRGTLVHTYRRYVVKREESTGNNGDVATGKCPRRASARARRRATHEKRQETEIPTATPDVAPPQCQFHDKTGETRRPKLVNPRFTPFPPSLFGCVYP